MFSVSRQGNGFTPLYYFVLQVSFAARLEFSSNRKVEKSDSAVRRAVVTWYILLAPIIESVIPI